MTPRYEGGCLCGQVRWTATAEPANIRACHCRLCQRWTGGPFFARAVFPAEGFASTGETTGWPREKLKWISLDDGLPQHALGFVAGRDD